MKSFSKTNINMIVGIINCFVSALQSLWYVPYITRRLGEEGYGYISVINSFINILSIFTLAITSMSTRFISVELQKDNKNRANDYFNSIFFSLLSFSSLIIIASIFVSNNLMHLIKYSNSYAKELKILVILVFLSFSIQLVSTPFLSTLYYKNDISIYYVVLIVDYLIRIVLTIILSSLDRGVFWSVAISDIVVFSFGLIIYNIYRKFKITELQISRKRFFFSDVIEVFKSGVWVSITKAGNVLLSNLNTYYSNILCGVFITGVYASMQQISTMVTMILGTLVNCFLPDMYKIYARDDEKTMLTYTLSRMKIIGVFIGILSGGLIALGKDFLILWLGEKYSQYTWILVLSVIYLPFVLPSEMVNQVAITTKKIKQPAVVTLIFGITNFILVLITNKVFNLGILGIIISNNITLFIRSMLYYSMYLCKVLNVKFNIRILTPYFFSGIILLFTSMIGMICRFFVPSISWMSLIIKSLITGGVALGISILLDAETRKFLFGFIKRSR